jgi:hypothetical protein
VPFDRRATRDRVARMKLAERKPLARADARERRA